MEFVQLASLTFGRCFEIHICSQGVPHSFSSGRDHIPGYTLMIVDMWKHIWCIITLSWMTCLF